MTSLSSNAEQMFCKLLVRNNLISAEKIQLIIGERSQWTGQTIFEELQQRQCVKPAHLQKVKSAIEAKGLTLEPSSAPGSSTSEDVLPSAQAASSTGSSLQQAKAPQGQSSSKTTLQLPDDSELVPSGICAPKGLGQQVIKWLEQAGSSGARDLHITTGLPVYIRSSQGDIIKLKTPSFTEAQTLDLLLDLISPTQKEKLFKDLQLDFALEISGGQRFRSNISKERQGWTATFRIVQSSPPSLDDLKLPRSVQTLTEYPTGLVLVTGPVGSGKSTTLAAMVDHINQQRKDHIITLEDPIEYRIAGKNCQVSQRSLGSHMTSFANALKGALRQDPDVIVVGELRDVESMALAITAAETGHLVLASMHTSSAERTIDRLVASFPPDQQAQMRIMLADSIRGIVSQQLIPSASGSGAELALEVLLNNTSVRKCIVDNKTFQLGSIIQTGQKQGMVGMVDSVRALVEQGKVSKEIAQRYVRQSL